MPPAPEAAPLGAHRAVIRRAEAGRRTWGADGGGGVGVRATVATRGLAPPPSADGGWGLHAGGRALRPSWSKDESERDVKQRVRVVTVGLLQLGGQVGVLIFPGGGR